MRCQFVYWFFCFQLYKPIKINGNRLEWLLIVAVCGKPNEQELNKFNKEHNNNLILYDLRLINWLTLVALKTHFISVNCMCLLCSFPSVVNLSSQQISSLIFVHFFFHLILHTNIWIHSFCYLYFCSSPKFQFK